MYAIVIVGLSGSERVHASVACGLAASAFVSFIKQNMAQKASTLAAALARGGLSLLLEAKDRVRAAIEALFNQVKQVKEALVSLVSRSTTALGRQARSALFLASMSGLVLICFGRRLVATGITSLRRLKGRASDQLSRTRESFRQLCNRAAHFYCSAIEGAHGVINRAASQVVSFVAIAAAVARGIVPSASTLAAALARGGLSLLLEAKDRVRAAIEALFNQVKQVKEALVSLVSRSTTALGRQARSALFLASMSGLVLICFGRRLVATGITSLRRLKGRASDQLSRTQASFRQLCNRAAHFYCSAIEGAHGVINRAA
ncbi:hypothetical protein THAOC_12392, partial [Thalassiosira oceanica]